MATMMDSFSTVNPLGAGRALGVPGTRKRARGPDSDPDPDLGGHVPGEVPAARASKRAMRVPVALLDAAVGSGLDAGMQWLQTVRDDPTWAAWWAEPLPAWAECRWYHLVIGHGVVGMASERDIEALVAADVIGNVSAADMASLVAAYEVLGPNEREMWHNDLTRRGRRPWHDMIDYLMCLWRQGQPVPAWDAMVWLTVARIRAHVLGAPTDPEALLHVLTVFPRMVEMDDQSEYIDDMIDMENDT